MILEVCAFNIQSCIIAAQAGAARIELCADPLQGGTTPSFGLVEYALEHISIPVFPMIRPRGGNFVYDAHELAIMKKDILVCRQLGCAGIATGVLTADGRIDVNTLKQIVEWADPMVVTCHKAFDVTHNAQQSLEDVISAGCKRVLTSGLSKTAVDGIATLAQLVRQGAGRIIIMPGGSVRSANIMQLADGTGANEFHSSCLLSKSDNHLADAQEVKKIVELLNT